MLKIVLFLTVLSLASIVDIRHKTVPTMVHIALFTVGFIDISIASWVGLVATFLPLFIVALIYPLGSIGGGDVKISALIGFCMGGMNGLISMLIGFSIAVIIIPIKNKITKQPRRITPSPFALVPFLTAGCFVFILLNGTFK